MPKVLLADDSATMQKVVDLVLREQGYEVVFSNTGEQAIELASSMKPDLVLAYIKMPGVDGYQICATLKGAPDTQGIPVILLAGAFDPVDEARKAQVKADGVLVKPFQAEELVKTVKQYAGAAAPAVAEAAPAEDDIMFDGEGSAAESFADVAEPVMDAESFADVAEPVMDAETFQEAEAVEAEEFAEAEPVMEAEAFEEAEAVEAEAVMEAEAFEDAEPVMEAEAFEEAAPAAPAINLGNVDAIIRESVQAKVSEALAAIDLKDLILKTLEPYAKEAFEKIAYDSVPEFLDRTLRGTINDSLGAVSKELENIIWETVPELAERLLKKELDRIRQESN